MTFRWPRGWAVEMLILTAAELPLGVVKLWNKQAEGCKGPWVPIINRCALFTWLSYFFASIKTLRDNALAYSGHLGSASNLVGQGYYNVLQSQRFSLFFFGRRHERFSKVQLSNLSFKFRCAARCTTKCAQTHSDSLPFKKKRPTSTSGYKELKMRSQKITGCFEKMPMHHLPRDFFSSSCGTSSSFKSRQHSSPYWGKTQHAKTTGTAQDKAIATLSGPRQPVKGSYSGSAMNQVLSFMGPLQPKMMMVAMARMMAETIMTFLTGLFCHLNDKTVVTIFKITPKFGWNLKTSIKPPVQLLNDVPTLPLPNLAEEASNASSYPSCCSHWRWEIRAKWNGGASTAHCKDWSFLWIRSASSLYCRSWAKSCDTFFQKCEAHSFHTFL